MKIAFDAKRLFLNQTGLGNYSRSLLRTMQLSYPNNEYHLFTPEKRHLQATEYFFDAHKFHLHESKARIKSYWRSFSIVKDLQKAGIDIYHGLSNELPHNINQSGIKTVVTIHDLIFKVFPETYSLSERVIYNRKFLNACQRADKIVAISENTRQDIIKLYQIEAEKIEVVYQSCNPIFYHLRSEIANKEVQQAYSLPSQFFLYVGSIEARKNIKLIIEAYQLEHTKIKIPVVLIGKGGQYKNDCKKLIAQYGLEQYFIWLENLSDNLHLQSIYQLASALIYPSFYEGFGLPIAEALLSKTPVIAADTSSLREAGGEHSLYIHPEKPQELSEAMLLLLHKPEYVEQMRQSGYSYAQDKFSPEKLTAQMMNLYQNIYNREQ